MDVTTTSYNNRALATAALYREVTQTKERILEIKELLPKGTEATVNILMATDVMDSSTTEQIYISAAVFFSKSQEGRLKVKATLAGYEVPCSDLKSPHALTYENTEKRVAELPSSENQIVVSRVPLITPKGIDEVRKAVAFGGDKRAPIGKHIFEQMMRIFSNGVPLPTNLDYHWAQLQIMVHQPPSYYELIFCAEGSRGTCEGRDRQAKDGHRWRSYASYSTVTVRSLQQELAERYDKSKAIAEGKVYPKDVPANARPMGSLSLTQGSSKALSNGQGQIEEIG